MGFCQERRSNKSVRISLEVHQKEIQELQSKDKDQI